MILAQRRKHSKNSSSVKLSSSLVSASVFFQLPLKRASFQDIREERSVEQKTPADCVDESWQEIHVNKRPCIKRVILPFTNKDTSIECSLEEKEMIRNYVNSHTENIRNQRYWDQLDSLLREKFTPEMLANIYLSYYEEKLKTNKAKLIYAPFSFKSDPDSNIKHSITPVPAKKDIILLTQIPNNKLKIKIDHIITEIKEEAKSSVDPDHLKAEEFGKILKSFHKLAQECRKLSSSYISDKEIVETLAKYDGETKLTLEHYYKLNKSSV